MRFTDGRGCLPPKRQSRTLHVHVVTVVRQYNRNLLILDTWTVEKYKGTVLPLQSLHLYSQIRGVSFLDYAHESD